MADKGIPVDNTLQQYRYPMDLSTQALEEETVKALKELKEIKEKN